MSYVDLKEINECRIKYKGEVLSIVSLLTVNGSEYYVVLAGGTKIKIDKETHSQLNLILDEHYRKHIFKKK